MLPEFMALLTVHYIGDFVLQTQWQAENKSKRLDALVLHVGVYTAALAVGYLLIFVEVFPRSNSRYFEFELFVLINGMAHFVTDFVTSKVTAALYARGDWHNFFVLIGLDQLIHQMTLAITMVTLIAH